jgi:hypothetical protein
MENIISQQSNTQRYISDLVLTILLSLTISGLCYWFYFLIAPWVWSQNIPFNLEDLAPVIRESIAQDGIEIYALYILVFVNLINTFVFAEMIRRSPQKTKNIIWAFCGLATALFFGQVGFIPPMNSFQAANISNIILQSLLIVPAAFLLVVILLYSRRRNFWLSISLAAVILAPICFIATAEISQLDYYFIIAPAQKLLNGVHPSNIYFQYDLLPSLLAAMWLKCGKDMVSFVIIGQAAFYITLLAIFVFSERFFEKKELSVFLLVSLIIIRIYAAPYGDSCRTFQQTPVRLDLWVPLLLLIYRKRPYHWITGVACGALLSLSKNMGIIYSLAYIQLLLTLLCIQYFDGERKASIWSTLFEYGKRCAAPLGIMAIMYSVSHFILTNETYGNYTLYYQKIGITFFKITRESFYWYVPSLISLSFILLTRLRKNVASSYLAAGYFLIYCAIGNSIYFFGQSHEGYILSISIVLIFLFIFFIDLVSRYLKEPGGNCLTPRIQHNLVITLASALIVIASISYSQTITDKVSSQIRNASQGQLIYPYNPPGDLAIFQAELRERTNFSEKVYFADKMDFYFTYYLGYQPVGYFSPFMSWLFMKDLKGFLQELLDNGYYVVCFKRNQSLLENLHFDKMDKIGSNIFVVSRNF